VTLRGVEESVGESGAVFKDGDAGEERHGTGQRKPSRVAKESIGAPPLRYESTAAQKNRLNFVTPSPFLEIPPMALRRPRSRPHPAPPPVSIPTNHHRRR
jgi:hypothetical protein